MLDEEKICPYPGLRPFQEEESIFFKGRDEHIKKSSALLEEKRFLMITGASGDGKSSIVYGGLIPYARAGFINSTYSNWAIADFRPERTPMANLAFALSTVMDGMDEGSIKTSLSRGYSSLVDLYKTSSLYVDKSDASWNSADDTEKKKLKRSASNLLIIVDQFEEFFTNAENYNQGQPSEESAIVVSTLLETVRIAIKEDLPIFVAFTMRSDYIGHCASFRGLPEFIGFSQFFVPRLKRIDLKKAIHEPAKLSGTKITDRLVERLLYDLSDGLDQLPILQHTLNRIWNLAEARNEPMDLLHYALAGGMNPSELSEEDRNIYSKVERKAGSAAHFVGLKNVLDTHANLLFKEATESNTAISKKKAELIVEITFKSLTRIDQDKPVRNRMTLEEITNTINLEEVSLQDVDTVIEVFRKEGNSFIKPYINPEEPTKPLTRDAVLDITHESLIRNWVQLKNWAIEESNHYKVFQELYTLYGHWQKNNRASSFLLPSGSLNYFEEWYEEVKPNAYWLHKHLKDSANEYSLKDAEDTLEGIREFIKKSIRNNFFARGVSKYGMLNILSAVGTTVLIFVCSFFLINSRQKQNDQIIEKIETNGTALLLTNKSRPFETGYYLLSLLKANPDEYFNYLEQVPDVGAKLYAIQNTFSILQTLDPDNGSDAPKQLLQWADEILEENEKIQSDSADFFNVSQRLYLLSNATALHFFTEDPFFKDFGKKSWEKSKTIIDNYLSSIEKFNASEFDLGELNGFFLFGIENKWLSESDTREYLEKISNLENTKNIDLKFYQDENPFFTYRMLIQLYAYISDVDKSLLCLNKYKLENFSGDESLLNDGRFLYTIHTFLLKGDRNAFVNYVNGISTLIDRPVYQVYRSYLDLLMTFDVFIGFNGRDTKQLLTLLGHVSELNTEEIVYFFNQYQQSLQSIENLDDRNFQTAIINKYEGLALETSWRYNSVQSDTAYLSQVFDSSLDYFTKVSTSYLNTNVGGDYHFDGGSRRIPFSKKQEFFYPDYIAVRDNKVFDRLYSGAFFDYLKNSGIAKSTFASNEGSIPLGLWVHNINQPLTSFDNGIIYGRGLDMNVLESVYEFYLDYTDRYFFNTSELAKLSYAYHLRYAGDATKAKEVLEHLDMVNLEKDYGGRTHYELFINMIMDDIVSVKGLPEPFLELSPSGFINSGKVMLNIQSLRQVYQKNDLLTSFSFFNRSIDFFNQYINSDVNVIYGAGSLEYYFIPMLVELNSNESDRIANRIINNADEINQGRNMKLTAQRKQVKAYAETKSYYQAFSSISESASISNKLNLYRYILDEYFMHINSGEEKREWIDYAKNSYQANYVTEDF